MTLFVFWELKPEIDYEIGGAFIKEFEVYQMGRFYPHPAPEGWYENGYDHSDFTMPNSEQKYRQRKDKEMHWCIETDSLERILELVRSGFVLDNIMFWNTGQAAYLLSTSV